MDTDEHPRTSSVEKMAALRPVFKKDGVVTSATASGICDGAGRSVLAVGACVWAKAVACSTQTVSAPDCTRGGRSDQIFGTSGPCCTEKPGIFSLGGAAIGDNVPDTYPSERATNSCKPRSKLLQLTSRLIPRLPVSACCSQENRPSARNN